MDQGDTMARLRRATQRAERAAQDRDEWLLKARAAGISYDTLAEVTGWDRRTVSRYLDKVQATLEASGYTVERSEGGRTLRATKNEGNNHGA